MTLPPGPPSSRSRFLRFFRLLKLIFRPLEYLDRYAQLYGDIIKVGGDNSPPFVYVGNPEAIQQIFSVPPDLLESGRGNRGVLKYLLGNNSLLMLDGASHQRQRKLLMPPFHGERLRSYSQVICQITAEVTSQWQPGQSLRIRKVTQDIALRVILRVVFGLAPGERAQQLRQLISPLLDSFASPLSSSMLFFPFLRKDWGSLSPWGRFLSLKKQVTQLIYEEIQERRVQLAENSESDSCRDDILTMLMQARDEAGQSLSDEELHDQLMTLLLAGHETTASALVWAFYWIHHLPEVRQQLLSELDALGANPEPQAIANLPYLSAVVAETLRIYPIFPGLFLRILKVPLEIAGYQFPAGTALMPSVYLVHHREELYPEPQQFRPERFLERSYSASEYLPFGGSNRRCIGSALAQLEMKLVIATILSRFQLQLKSTKAVKPVRRGLTLAPPLSLEMLVAGLRSPDSLLPNRKSPVSTIKKV